MLNWLLPDFEVIAACVVLIDPTSLSFNPSSFVGLCV